ncbi:MAG TPA: RDD family protein [Steroidobacteraceae bacterium]|nr:RDD family protein [Steroidobacteraceae bacterium]
MPDRVVDSATGVTVALPIAGTGARSFAFLIDWHIRAILCVAWYSLAAILYNGEFSLVAPLTPDSRWFLYILAPPTAVFFLYHAVLEVVMQGRTPGKRMAGVQIVSRDGGAPSVGALLTRNVFRLVDSLPLAYCVGIVTTLVTQDQVRIGDLAAGTVLVYDRSDALPRHGMRAGSRPSLDTETAEVIGDLLQRWSSLDAPARRRLARAALSRLGTRSDARAGVVGEPSSLHDDEDLKRRLEAAIGVPPS